MPTGPLSVIQSNGQTANSQVLSAPMAHLNLKSVPTLVGKGQIQQAKHLYQIVCQTNIPLYLIGDSGTGKTATMKNILKTYSIRYNVPAYYFQLSPEDNKTLVILGNRLHAGSMVPFKGVVAQAAEENAIIGIDEVTHSTVQMLLALNSIDGNDSIISIGDMSIDASKLKIIYGSNAANHIGNIRVPQSFANRVIGFPFQYPSLEDEIEIAKSLAIRDFNGAKLTVPDTLYRYIVAYMRPIRTSEWPLSVRNVAKAILLCELAQKNQNAKLDRHFTSGNEATRRTLTERILGKVINDVSIMQKPEIVDFCQYVSSIGVNEFREIIKIAMNYYIDMDGVELSGEQVKNQITAQII